MKDNQKENMSYLMDGGQVDPSFIDELSADSELFSTWKRYHLTRDIMKNSVESDLISIDVTESVMKALNFEEAKEFAPEAVKEEKPSKLNLFWTKVTNEFGKVAQVGVAAGVTLMVITGVQSFNSNSDSADPILNPTPVGVTVSPVGGINPADETIDIDQEHYNKIRLLTQEYELIKRLNAF